MSPTTVLILSFLIGLFTGSRSSTPIAIVAWAERAGWIAAPRYFAWIGALPVAIIFTVLAIVEIVYDKLSWAPPRTAPPGLTARIVMGAVTGVCVAATGTQSAAAGAIAGVVGALVGTFGGFQLRTRLVKSMHAPDFVIAIAEDLVTIGGSLWVVTRF